MLHGMSKITLLIKVRANFAAKAQIPTTPSQFKKNYFLSILCGNPDKPDLADLMEQ